VHRLSTYPSHPPCNLCRLCLGRNLLHRPPQRLLFPLQHSRLGFRPPARFHHALAFALLQDAKGASICPAERSGEGVREGICGGEARYAGVLEEYGMDAGEPEDIEIALRLGSKSQRLGCCLEHRGCPSRIYHCRSHKRDDCSCGGHLSASPIWPVCRTLLTASSLNLEPVCARDGLRRGSTDHPRPGSSALYVTYCNMVTFPTRLLVVTNGRRRRRDECLHQARSAMARQIPGLEW
jgi:hypothetical protein